MEQGDQRCFERIYRAAEIPDPRFSGYATVADGGVREAAWQAWEHLLRFVADLPPVTASVALRYVCDPEAGEQHPRLRLRLYVSVHASERSTGLAITSLIEHSALGELYALEEVNPPELPWGELRSACHVFRRDAAIPPLVSSDWNPEIPSAYFVCEPFASRPGNDFLALDGLADGLAHPAMVELCVWPICGDTVRRAHVRYEAGLRAVNQTWRNDDDAGDLDLLADPADAWARQGRERVVRPYRRPDPMADEVARRQRRFGESLEQPRLGFHVIALAEDEASSRLLGSTVAEAAFGDGKYQLRTHSDAAAIARFRGLLGAAQRLSARDVPGPHPNAEKAGVPELAEVCHSGTVEELSGLFRLPVGGVNSPRCIRMKTDSPLTAEADSIVLGYAIGRSVNGWGTRSRACPEGILPSVLTKHLFACGMPGSGKTTMLLYLMIKLHELGIPFLAIECSKRDLRALKRLVGGDGANGHALARALETYTLGQEEVSPFRINPLVLGTDVTLAEHLDSLLAAFYAGMPLPGPLPAILGEALEKVYEGRKDGDPAPVMSDLVRAAGEVLKSKGYSPDVESDIRAAIEVRLSMLTCRSMGKILQSPSGIPSAQNLLSGYSVVELDRLPVDQKCLTSLFLLKCVLDEARSLPPNGGGLRFVVLIDEAHNVVGATSSSVRSEDFADPRSHASEYVCRMLAELRGLGVGIVIADQLPSAVAPEVIKLTGTQLAFRQVDAADRETIGRAMLLAPTEEEELARLRPGEAFLFSEGFHTSRKIRTVNLHQEHALTPPSDRELVEVIRDQPWFKANSACLGAMEFMSASRATDVFDKARADVAAQSAQLLPRLLKAKTATCPSTGGPDLAELGKTAQLLKERLGRLSVEYRNSVLPSVHSHTEDRGNRCGWPIELEEAWDGLFSRVRDVTLVDTERLLSVLNRVVTE